SSHAAANQRCSESSFFKRHSKKVIAYAEVECQGRCDFPVVFEEYVPLIGNHKALRRLIAVVLEIHERSRRWAGHSERLLNILHRPTESKQQIAHVGQIGPD